MDVAGKFVAQHARGLRADLTRRMVDANVLRDPGWRAAFEQVPRHVFLSRYFAQCHEGGWTAVHAGDPAWLRQVYSDRVWVTQLDGDESRWAWARRGGPVRGAPTCSSSMPTIMAIMLEALEVRRGHKVLEVGTGTGYNAALLCHRLGSANVTTVDVDPAVLTRARAHLDRAGYRPTVVSGDGALGHPANAPYDRVLATCAVARIPLPWLEQTTPGGLLVTTLHRPLGAGLVRITAGEGRTGVGRVLAEDGRFMPLRADRGPAIADLLDRVAEQDGQLRPTDLDATEVTVPASAFEFYAGLALPAVLTTSTVRGGGVARTWLLHPDGSWVRHTTRRGTHAVVQGGPRRLWDLVEDAHREWQAFGRPTRSRFGITVNPTSQDLWLDSPDSPHRWPL